MKKLFYSSQPDLYRLACDWVVYFGLLGTQRNEKKNSPEMEKYMGSIIDIGLLILNYPDKGWELINIIFHKVADDPEMMACLAAGPLEDLLVEHGEKFISEVEELALANHKFKELLTGVWRNRISCEVWKRIRKAVEST
jgi:hypothetical protein